MRNADFFGDFDFFTKKINSGEPFAFARYADGEVKLMKGDPVGKNTQAFTVDGWGSTGGNTLLGEELNQSMNHEESNYYYAISAPTDSFSDFEFLNRKIKNGNRTFVNLWINANYKKMKDFYESLDKEVWVVCNQEGVGKNFPFKANVIPFPDDCITFWELNSHSYMSSLIELFGEGSGKTLFISAGPASEAIIHRLYQKNSGHQYIDVGSSIDEYVHGRETRPYMNSSSAYSREVSRF